MGRPKKVTSNITGNGLSVDDKVSKALALIEEKRAALAIEKSNSTRGWKTTGKVRIGGDEYQIQTLDKDTVIELAGKLTQAQTVASQGFTVLGLPLGKTAKSFKGLDYDDLFTDLRTRLAKIDITETERALAELEAKAKALRSEDQKRASATDDLLAELGQ